ncbi:putative glutamate--cysteine ligase [Dirofilaria immitis]
MEIEMILATKCHFSRPSQTSPTSWIDVIDECKESETDAICFSGYNPIVAYYHRMIGCWRVFHTENKCLTKQYLRKKLACSDDEETPTEGRIHQNIQ